VSLGKRDGKGVLLSPWLSGLISLPNWASTKSIHVHSTTSRKSFKSINTFITEADSRAQCQALEDNVKEFGLTYFGMGDRRQGIVHIIGPEQGFTLPGTTVVCGDSHTSSESWET
jgi:homoaconitase/3-isopropylmalate dehydratase large subunit